MQRQTQPPRLARRSDEDLRVLAAACDIAVLRALELVGKRIARDEVGRARYGAMRASGREWHEAHTIWTPSPGMVDAALSNAWSTLPRLVAEHGCCALVEPDLTRLLDNYVRGLVAAARPHSFEDLAGVLAHAVVT